MGQKGKKLVKSDSIVEEHVGNFFAHWIGEGAAGGRGEGAREGWEREREGKVCVRERE